MAFGDGAFRSRAASFLLPSTISASPSFPPHTVHEKDLKTATEQLPNEKQLRDSGYVGHVDLDRVPIAGPEAEAYHSSGHNAVAHDREAQRIVRTIPG